VEGKVASRSPWVKLPFAGLAGTLTIIIIGVAAVGFGWIRLGASEAASASSPSGLLTLLPRAAYEDYLTHHIDALQRLTPLLESLRDSSAAHDFPQEAADASELAAFAETEIAWMDSHPALPCCETRWSEWRDSLSQRKVSTEKVRDGASTGDAGLMLQGMAALRGATAALCRASDAEATNRC
jgi:hypothetical protein